MLYQYIQTIKPDIVLNLLTLLIVVFTAWAANMARRAADKTHKNTQAQIVMTLLDEYGSEDMLEALKGLRDKRNEHQVYYEKRFEEQRNTDPNWDRWRRRVAHYFHKVAVLYDKGLLDKEYAVVVATKGQVEFLKEVIEPLEVAIISEYGRFMFNVLDSLHEDQKPTSLKLRSYR